MSQRLHAHSSENGQKVPVVLNRRLCGVLGFHSGLEETDAVANDGDENDDDPFESDEEILEFE